MLKKLALNVWKMPLLLAFFFLGANGLYAQTYVPKDLALLRLEVKLAEVQKSADQGLIPMIERQIADSFIEYMVVTLENNQTVMQAIEVGFNKTSQLYDQSLNQVNKLKSEIEILLQ